MKKLSNKGFTLVELIIVIAILAIIMLIAIPNVPQIIQRNRVRTDMVAAEKIAEFVRAWHSDYSTDPLLSEDMTEIPAYNATDKKVTPIDYTTIVGLDTYVTDSYAPSSLLDEYGVAEEDQYFAVFFEGTNLVVAIVDAIEEVTLVDTIDLDANGKIQVNYDGYPNDAEEANPKHAKSGPIAFIEGK